MTENLIFLFTDLENSTRLWEKHPEAMKGALARHDAILHAAVEEADGQVVKSTGDGLMAVFYTALDGLQACLTAQLQLLQEPWSETGPLLVRMGLHPGEAQQRAGDYYGPAVNRAARLMAVGHGGQVLISAAAANLLAGRLPEGSLLRDLHEHRLKDLERPEHVFQLCHPGLMDNFPPLASLNQRPNNLPTQTSTFLGREAELAELKTRLAAADVRLLTLTGPGGTGKTRLALQAAAELIDAFEDGVYLVDLAPFRDPDDVLTAVGRTIGLAEEKERAILDALAGHLKDRHMLLLLDNFEQVTTAATRMVVLLQACPQLKLLVTSREALRIRGEYLYAVPPLGLPGSDSKGQSAEQLGRAEAVQLFVDRARAVRPDFVLTDENAAVVAEICRRLDGLPLAIELASARIKLFPPTALLARLEDSLKLLRGGARDLPLRQQTLHNTIEWSYELLDAGEQRLFTLLSIFSGGTFDAVEDVSGRIRSLDTANQTLAGQTLAKLDILDGLVSLVDKSLIRRLEEVDGESRLMMLGTIREFAAGRLLEDPTFCDEAQRAHAAYYADFAQEQWTRLAGRERDWALVLAAEIKNLQIAWSYWAGEKDLERLNQLVDSLWGIYDSRGWYRATVDLATELLQVLSTVPSTPERAQQEIMLYISLARVLLATRGYTAEAEQAYRRALELSEAAGEIPQLFPVLRGLYNFYVYRAEFRQGAEIGKKILRLAEIQDDDEMRVVGHYALGSNIGFLNQLKLGLGHLDKALSTYNIVRRRSPRFRTGNDPGVVCHTTAAFFLWMLGMPDSALEKASGGLALAGKLNHPLSLAYAHYHFGFLNLWLRKPEIVRQHALDVLEIAEKHEFQIWQALGACLHGAAITGLGRAQEGLAQVKVGIAQYQGLTTPPVFWSLILFMEANACLQAGQTAEGLAYMDEAMSGGNQDADGAKGTDDIDSRALVAETFTMKGILLLAQSPANQTEAESCFQQAISLAGSIEARLPQLRAAIPLARLWQDQGKTKEAIHLLSGVYATFTEGFTTADLIEARTLIEEFSLIDR